MMKRSFTFTMLMGLILAGMLAGVAFAQDSETSKPRAMYLAIPPHSYYNVEPSSQSLTQWVYSFTYNGTKYTPTIVGTSPITTNSTTTVPVEIIPIKLVYAKNNGNKTFDPNKDIFPGTKLTVTKYVEQSPIFVGINFTQGGVNLGTTQYEDAYERGSFWKYVSKNTNYHVLLGTPKVLPEQTVQVPVGDGSISKNPFGPGNVGFWSNINAVDQLLQTYLQKFKSQITPNTLPLFLVYDNYIGCGSGCAIGGYHSANGGQPSGQTYSFTTIMNPNSFSASTGALSHEFGEWLLDPFTDNPGCGGLMENGDPLETEPNYGLYTFKGANGDTYSLQDLVFIDYFGASRSVSLKKWFTFQNETNVTAPCDRGQ